MLRSVHSDATRPIQQMNDVPLGNRTASRPEANVGSLDHWTFGR